jgi:hypothetical protein
MGQAMVPYQPGTGGMVGTLKSEGGLASGPTRRNPIMTLLLPFAVIFGGAVLGSILSQIMAALGAVGSLVSLAGSIWFLLIAIKMVSELRTVTRSEALAWWPLIVPFYNYYFIFKIIPDEMDRAKQMLGVRQPRRSRVIYFFLFPYAFAADLNDLVR